MSDLFEKDTDISDNASSATETAERQDQTDTIGGARPDPSSAASKDPDEWVTGDEPMTGLEVELNLVGTDDLEPTRAGRAVLDALGSPEFQTELGRWNLELNLPPRPLRWR